MAEYKIDFQKTIEDAFLSYAGYVTLYRAIPDARDGLKHGARQGLYAQFHDKITHDKPFQKAQRSVAAGVGLCYVHGDTSLYGTLIRQGKPFVFRYPLQDIQGSFGDQMNSENHAAQRYVEMRQSELAGTLFEGINKDTVDKWVLNYDDTERIPSVLPSPFFYNIVNGATGIGVGMAVSIPQFNLREVNKAMVKLIKNPDASFEELYCPIDFATGGLIINEEQVKESLKYGRGKSAVVRAKLTYDAKKNMLFATEIPYSVYTETICGEIGALLDGKEGTSIGIERILDATKGDALIEISLSKKADPESVKRWLYANTSLQSYFGINMTMLDGGSRPRVFGWRDALAAHVEHMRLVKRREYEFDLRKAKARLHIIEGLLIAIAHIDEFLALIRASSSATEAMHGIMETWGLSELQAKAVLDIKLSRLVKLEYLEVKKEQQSVIATIEDISDMLTNQSRFDSMLIDGLEQVANKFGDARRTVNANIARESEEKVVEIVQPEDIKTTISIYSNGDIFMVPYGGKGKSGLSPANSQVYLVERLYGSRSESILLLSKNGMAYTLELNPLEVAKKYNLYQLLEIPSTDRIVAAIHTEQIKEYPEVFVATKNGLVKKTATVEYLTKKRKSGILIGKLKEEDSFVSCRFIPKDANSIVLFSQRGQMVRFAPSDFSAIGRTTQGVKGIKLGADDFLADAIVLAQGQEEGNSCILSVTEKGVIKKTAIRDLSITGRYLKGTLVHKPETGDVIARVCVSNGREKIVIGSNSSSIIIDNSELPLTAKGEKTDKELPLRTGSLIDYMAPAIGGVE